MVVQTFLEKKRHKANGLQNAKYKYIRLSSVPINRVVITNHSIENVDALGDKYNGKIDGHHIGIQKHILSIYELDTENRSSLEPPREKVE